MTGRLLEFDTLSNQDIYNGGSGLLIGTYVADAVRTIAIEAFVDQIAGNGDYKIWATRQLVGAGTEYKSMVTTEAVASGQTNIWFPSLYIRVANTDVVKVYVLGLSGDTATPDTRVEFWEDDALTPATPDREIELDASGYVTVAALIAAALADFFNTDSGETGGGAVAGSVVDEIIENINAVAFPAGAIDFTYTITDDVTLLPIEGVEVWFTTDVGGVNIVWKGDTDAFGVARDVLGNLPALDVGDYFVWRQRSGYTFSDPDTETVS